MRRRGGGSRNAAQGTRGLKERGRTAPARPRVPPHPRRAQRTKEAMDFNVGVGVVDSHKTLEGFTAHTQNGLDGVLEKILAARLTVLAELDITAFSSPEPLTWEHRLEGEERTLRVGDKWGGLFDCAWMHFTGVVPPDAPSSSLVLLLDVNGEMCVFDLEGQPQRGLTSLTSEFDLSLGKPGKRVMPLPPGTAAGSEVDVWADCGCNDLFGNLQENGVVRQACIAVLDESVQALYHDMEVLCDFLKVLPEASARARQILHAVSSAAKAVQPVCDAASAETARAILAPHLAKQGGDPDLKISACGHAHMDLAWLWPIRETMRKAARTFATVLANMERYPSYVFGASQPQQLLWIKEQHPEMFHKIQQRVQEGRWECQGAMWVEPDTNITSGESLIRQILLGKSFWREDFNVEVKNMWEPDVFGYSAALPQILKRSGVDYMMTQKLSWNTVNFFPHHSFNWQGVDGTVALVHTLPEETYNSPALPRAVHKIATNYREAGVSDHALMLFGIGDGGGGPGTEHLERLERLTNLAGLSPVTQESAAHFFEQWETQASSFPTWVGELYLEKHQGTFTTNAATKKGNRAMEIALRELELVSVQLMLVCKSNGSAAAADGDQYPHNQLRELWREVLLYQFHDILPGSSIKRVYDECEERYAEMLQAVGLMTAHSRTRLLELSAAVPAEAPVAVVAAAGASASAASAEPPPVLWNTLSWPRSEWVRHGEEWLYATVPGLGAAPASLDTASALAAAQTTLLASGDAIENDVLRVTFDTSSGSILSIFDKQHGCEVLSEGDSANRLAVYVDDGDAWDFPMDCKCAVLLRGIEHSIRRAQHSTAR
jgi:alpha-mannosidase